MLELRDLSDEELLWTDPATGKVHGTVRTYQTCTIEDGGKCARCKEAKRRRNKYDQDSLRERDPDYFVRQARRRHDRLRVAAGKEPLWNESGTEPYEPGKDVPHLEVPAEVSAEPGFKELPPHVHHGTEAGYGYYGCRCSLCRRAHADRQMEFKYRGVRDPKGWDGLPVEHLKGLRKGDPTTPLATQDNRYGTVRLDQPSKPPRRGNGDREDS